MNKQAKLSEKELEQFYRLKHSLYLYANRTLNTLKHTQNWEDIGNNEPENIMKVRQYVFEKNISIISTYVKENPDNFNEEDLEILSQWKEAIPCEKAILFKHTNENSLFLVNNSVYAVSGLMDSFKDIFDEYVPLFIDLIILPFKEKLVHEGLFSPYNISFGKSMRDGINSEAEEIMLKKGVVTSLNETVKDKETSDEDLLRFYMKSEKNQDRFFEKIEILKEKSEKLHSIYVYEIGRINARHIKKQIKNQGIKGHFAILFSQVIASGCTKKELNDNIQKIIPEEKRSELYFISI